MTLRDISRARVAQVNRVNARTREEYEREIDTLKSQVAQLQALLMTYQADETCAPAEKTLHGRPVLSISEAAARAGIKYWTAYRYVQEKYWDAEQDSDRQWMVFADQPLVKKPRKSRRKT